MKYSFSNDPAISEKLFDLLDTIFPGVRRVAQNARALAASWESVSTPFIHFEHDLAVSHVGVIEIPLVLLGQTVKVGSIHGVATRPDHRRRGHFGRLIEEATEYCADRYETLILTTEHPEYFEPFGFRVIREHLFTTGGEPSGGDGLRLMDVTDARGIALLHRLLETREPVSQVVGVVNEKGVFCFNEGSRPLHYSRDLDAVVCLEIEARKLKLFDVVAPEMPSLAALLERLPYHVDQVEICFAADRLAPEAEPSPYIFDHDGPSYFMARGPFAPEGQPFTLPRSART